MAQNPYSLLGVSRTASEAEIKSAYRKLAKKLHPDMNPGRTDIEQKFKEVTAAYDLLSDPKKRARFDRGEIDEQGNEKGFAPGNDYSSYGGFGRGARGRRSNFNFGGGFSPEDIFAEFFGGNAGPQGTYEPERGTDVSYEIVIPFTEACLGGKKRVTLAGGKTLDINIPPGVETGHKLRLRGLGRAGRGHPGDAIVEIQVAPHAYFRREGQDIHLDLPISLPEAILGGSINVPTLEGKVALKLQKGANTGTVMRLKGKGVPRAKGAPGDMFVTLKVMLPGGPLPELEAWAEKSAYDPRKKLGW